MLAVVLVVLPVGWLLLRWLPWRLRYAREAGAARRLLAGTPDLEILAARALATAPLPRLAALPAGTGGAWHAGDPRRCEPWPAWSSPGWVCDCPSTHPLPCRVAADLRSPRALALRQDTQAVSNPAAAVSIPPSAPISPTTVVRPPAPVPELATGASAGVL